MRLKLLEVLVCPQCQSELACQADETAEDGEVLQGTLRCTSCAGAYPVEDGVPRFVSRENYASSFGFQWNRFRSEQLDSLNGITQSSRRLFTETGWDVERMKGKWVLDAGCGAGRFLDVASKAGYEIVGVDITNAVDAARETLAGRANVHLVQASIYELPFRKASFDACYCIGVLQHTPDPEAAIRALPRVLKPGGELAVTIYERKWYTPFNSKYLIRSLTRRLDNRVLLRLLKVLMPILFPLTEVLFRLPGVGRLFMFIIPIANYVHDPELSLRQRYQWAILDTFDMLSPRYDYPQREADVRRALASSGITKLTRRDNPGVNLVGVKRA